jgi:hypothetical protein
MRVKYRHLGTQKFGTRRKEHRAIVETVLGRSLRGSECVHHVNGNGLDNAHENLVICPDQAYHMLLHARERAFDACGNASFRKCKHCKLWDDPSQMKEHRREGGRSSQYHHLLCQQQYDSRRNSIRS